ncbi:hypothetical protein ACFV1F_22430 [Streptomyces sp. NPDC059590]|uniref:hypothetical protein n=1 Tax=Streptomyces sp. NPDC059590 TaxID=3346877 RepID=UPI003694A56E
MAQASRRASRAPAGAGAAASVERRRPIRAAMGQAVTDSSRTPREPMSSRWCRTGDSYQGSRS